MATYPYRCPKCIPVKEKDVIAKMTETHDPPVCDCGTTMERVYSPIPFTFGTVSEGMKASVSQSRAEQTDIANKKAVEMQKKKYKSRFV